MKRVQFQKDYSRVDVCVVAQIKLIFVIFILISTVLCDIGDDIEVISAAEAEIGEDKEISYEKDRPDRDAPVSYEGSQLWRVPYGEQGNKDAVSQLQNQYNASMWNLQLTNPSNQYVDVFVKRAAVIVARNFMKTNRVPFNVLMDNVQRAVDTQNPPLNNIDLWVNRNGKLKNSCRKFLGVFSRDSFLLERECIFSHFYFSLLM